MDSVRRTRGRRWLGVIVAVGFLLRLAAWKWGQGYAYFQQNDAIEAYSVAVKYWNGDERARYLAQPNCNPKSKLPGPLWTLFCYWPLRVSGSIEGVIGVMVVLNVAALVMTYFLAEAALGAEPALWAASIFAVLPTAVFYSAEVYNPDVMPFLGAALALALWRALQRENSWWIAMVGALFIIMPQFHMSGLMLGPPIILVLWLAAVRLSIPWLLVGIAAGLACYVPYLRGEMAHCWQNTRGMFSGGHGRSWDSLKMLIAPFTLLVNWVPQWTRTFGDYRALGRACVGSFWILAAFNLVSAISALAMMGIAGTRVTQALCGFLAEPRQAFAMHKGLLFLAVMFVGPLLCGFVTGQPFHARYGLVLLPALTCLAGFAVVELFKGSEGAGASEPNEKKSGNSNAAGAGRASATPAEQERRAIRPSWGTAQRLGLIATLTTMAFNLWFVPAMFFQRGRMIDEDAAFVPAFRNLDRAYSALQRHAGPGRNFSVDAGSYVSNLTPGDEVHAGALLLAAYIAIRQQEAGSRAVWQGKPVIYQLRAAGQVEPGDPNVAYRGHGIAIVRS